MFSLLSTQTQPGLLLRSQLDEKLNVSAAVIYSICLTQSVG